MLISVTLTELFWLPCEGWGHRTRVVTAQSFHCWGCNWSCGLRVMDASRGSNADTLLWTLEFRETIWLNKESCPGMFPGGLGRQLLDVHRLRGWRPRPRLRQSSRFRRSSEKPWRKTFSHQGVHQGVSGNRHLRRGKQGTIQAVHRKGGILEYCLCSLYCPVVTKRELSQKAKLLIDQSVFVPSLTYGH